MGNKRSFLEDYERAADFPLDPHEFMYFGRMVLGLAFVMSVILFSGIQSGQIENFQGGLLHPLIIAFLLTLTAILLLYFSIRKVNN